MFLSLSSLTSYKVRPLFVGYVDSNPVGIWFDVGSVAKRTVTHTARIEPWKHRLFRL